MLLSCFPNWPKIKQPKQAGQQIQSGHRGHDRYMESGDGVTYLTVTRTVFQFQMCAIFLSLPDRPLHAVATSAHLPTASCADVSTPPSVEDLADLTAGSRVGTVVYRTTGPLDFCSFFMKKSMWTRKTYLLKICWLPVYVYTIFVLFNIGDLRLRPHNLNVTSFVQF